MKNRNIWYGDDKENWEIPEEAREEKTAANKIYFVRWGGGFYFSWAWLLAYFKNSSVQEVHDRLEEAPLHRIKKPTSKAWATTLRCMWILCHNGRSQFKLHCWQRNLYQGWTPDTNQLWMSFKSNQGNDATWRECSPISQIVYRYGLKGSALTG